MIISKSLRYILNAFLIGFTILFVSYHLYKSWRLRKEFYEAEIHSTIIESEPYYERSVTFFLKDGNSITFRASENSKILIGDSISKPRNTSIYQLFRKDDTGSYYYLKSYDDEKSN